MDEDDIHVDRGQYETEIALLKAEVSHLRGEVEKLTKQVTDNEKEHKDFFKSVIRALLGIIGAIATGFSAMVLEGRF